MTAWAKRRRADGPSRSRAAIRDARETDGRGLAGQAGSSRETRSTSRGRSRREGLAGQVDLVYVDPPFGSQAAYVHEARLDGPADGRVVRTQAYDDRWGESLGGVPRHARAAARCARASARAARAPSGCTSTTARRTSCRLVLDEILGREAFVNEIVWRRAPNLGRQAASHQFGRTLDTLVVYGKEDAKLVPPTRLEPIEPSAVRTDAEGRPFTTAPRGDYTDASIARLEKEGRVHRTRERDAST